MTSKYRAPDDLLKTRENEDDVEGHGLNKKSAPDGINRKASAVEDDVEGHGLNKKSAPDGINRKASAVEDDVEGHGLNKKSAPDGINRKASAVEDDVEGHMIGSMNPVMARELARAKERDVQRATSRGSLISDAKRAIRRKD
jgi:hypothetical protein